MPEVDKDQLYGQYERRQKWREGLAKKASHKALDIPLDDDMIINVRKGWGWRELLILGTVACGMAWLLSRENVPEPIPPAPIEIPSDSDTLFELHLGKETT